MARGLKKPVAKKNTPPPKPKALRDRYKNTKAPAITADDIAKAAENLGVTPKHIGMVIKVESGGRSFDKAGRPVILPEPHIFHRLTGGKYSPSSFSYKSWGQRPYPGSFAGRWDVLEQMAERDEDAALQSASWGMFQIMGFHWKDLGYDSPQAFAKAMTESEANHLEAVVRFIRKNKLVRALRQCKAGDPRSCRDFARGYNGPGFTRNRYHFKMAKALA